MKTNDENRNLVLSLILSVIVLVIWHFTWQLPQQRAQAEKQRIAAELAKQHAPAVAASAAPMTTAHAIAPSTPNMSTAPAQTSRRIPIISGQLKGSLTLRGARFDDLTLSAYRETIAADAPAVKLLAPSQDKQAYVAEFGWLAAGSNTKLPDNNTEWSTDATELNPKSPIILRWDNGQGVVFEKKISMDENYMFTIEHSVINRTTAPINLAPYGLLSRSYVHEGQNFAILHEGPLGISEGVLEEHTYSDLKDDGNVSRDKSTGWVGVSDKYWLTAIIPSVSQFKTNYSYYNQNGQDKYQADFVGAPITVEAGKSQDFKTLFFAGAKRLQLLDGYAKQYNIPLFDRAVDFGRLYFITKPLFELLHYFYQLIGNFGLAIMLLTVVVKLVLYPLANKSYASMAHMREIMPQMTQIKERYADDRVKMNQEIMELYRREKVSPAAGCLPMLIQLPVFFALYKVLFVTLEMRQSPFYGWIHDLSVADPTNIFTLFGLINWNPPSFLHIGVLPLVMTITMIVQQRMNPKPADPVQAQVITLMPYVFVFMFSGFPAGLVLYWAWNNLLSVLQQWVITRRHDARSKQRKLAAA